VRVGVFHCGALGDCILTLHVVDAFVGALAEPGGDSTTGVTLIARSPVARLAARRSIVRAAVDFDRQGMHTLFAASPTANTLDARVRDVVGSFDLILSFCGAADTPPASQLRQVASCPVVAVDPRLRPETAACRRHITRQWLDDLANQWPPCTSFRVSVRPESQTSMAASRAGTRPAAQPGGRLRPTRGQEPLIRTDDALRCYGRRVWESRPGSDVAKRAAPDRIILHPGSGGKAKCWPLERFEELMRTLCADGRQAAWMIGPAETDLFGDEFARRLERTAHVVYEDDLTNAASVIACADVFVGNDAGITHLAAALGAPTVALFGPTDPNVWRPLGPRVRTLGGRGPCAATVAHQSSDAFADVHVGKVAAAIRDLYGR